MNSSSTIQIRG